MEKRESSLKIYNTLSRKKQPFYTKRPGEAAMYVCGVTVYDECHLGHARAYVSFDVIKRYLAYRGLRVTHIQNFTDIDDKIIDRARRFRDEEKKKGVDVTLQKASKIIAEKYTEDYFRQMDKLNIGRASAYPKATEHIQEMTEAVQKLIDKGFAYPAESGVYFSIEKFKNYGRLSGRDPADMKAGARVKAGEDKKHPLDFVLWKKAGEDEPSWDSPFGRGRPGWHIECSAMSMKYLGETMDIHGGGADLVFPHNENEIAQSEALTGKPFAAFWVHNGFVTVEREKMSKSLGNFYTVREILERYSPQAVRLFFLSSHYRSPVDFSEAELEKAESKYRRLAECDKKIASAPKTNKKSPEAKKILEEFEEHMDNDFNTPGALAAVFNLARRINTCFDSGEIYASDAEFFVKIREVLGLPASLEKPGFIPREECPEEPPMNAGEVNELLEAGESIAEEDIKRLLMQREALRKNKRWEEADEIRNRLGRFLDIKDAGEGVSWERLK